MKEREANLKRSYNIVEEKEGLFHNFYLSSYFVRPSMENLLIAAISTRLLCKFFKRKKEPLLIIVNTRTEGGGGYSG